MVRGRFSPQSEGSPSGGDEPAEETGPRLAPLVPVEETAVGNVRLRHPGDLHPIVASVSGPHDVTNLHDLHIPSVLPMDRV